MEIKPRDISQFKKLYADKFNIKLTNGIARIKLLMLVRQMEIIYPPIEEDVASK